MPPVILAIAAVAAYAGASLLVVSALVIGAGTAIYGAAQARKAERDAKNSALAAMKDRMVTRIATEAPHRHVYGRAKVGADIVAMFTSGDRDQYRHLVCVHAAHECDAIEEVYVNNVLVSSLDAQGDPTTGRYATNPNTEIAEEAHTGPTFTLARTPQAGSVWVFSGTDAQMVPVTVSNVSGRTVTIPFSGPVLVSYEYRVVYKFGVSQIIDNMPSTAPVVRVRKHLGNADDVADAYLRQVLGDKWPATAVLRGLCYTVITLDLNHPEFQSGLVPIHAVIRGKKLYDPRDGVTRWSQNPALAIRDYLTGPLCGVPAADLPAAQFITAANVCDEASPTGGARYTVNGTVTSDQGQASVLESMTQAMAGGLVATTWDVYAGKYVAPVAALVQSDIVGGLSVTPGVSDASIYNGVKGQYIGPENKYVQTDFKPYQNSVYRESDGRDLFNNLDFPFTDSLQRVTNLARVFTEDQRNGFTIRAEFSLKAWPLKVGQRITFTSAVLGHNAKVFRITDKSYSPTSAVQLTLKEDDASIWDYADATVVDSTPNSDLPDPWKIDAPASLSCTSGEAALLRQADGTTVPRIMASWPAMAQANGVQIEVEWRAVSSPTWERTTVSGGDTRAYLSSITPGFFYIVRARTVNPSLGVRSNWIATVYQVEVFKAAATVYMWSTDMPAPPTGVGSYLWSNGTFGAAPSGWSLTEQPAPLAGNTTQWAAIVPLSDITAAATTPFNWATASIANVGYAPSAAGQGPAGYSNVTVSAFQRKATAPVGTPGAVNVDLTTGKITTATLANGWLKDMPADDGNPCYATYASASGTGATDDVAANEWSGGIVLVRSGAKGDTGNSGLNNATVRIFQRSNSATAPALPTADVTYTFATGAVSGLNNNWLAYIPTAGGPYLHTSLATAAATTPTDTISPGEFAASQLMYDAADLLAAKAAADAANQAVADMARDDLLSPAEKSAENLRWNTIVGERPGIDTTAAALGITSERTAYTDAYNTLNAYIAGFGTAFSTIPGAAISIVGATYRANFKAYTDAKQALLNKIAAVSATTAQWAGVNGVGKPADNASSDLVLLSTGTVSITGNRAIKASGTASWDSSVTSRDSYAGGAYASVRVENLANLMFGLNSDPNSDSSWTSLDYAMELRADGGLWAWESQVARGGLIGIYAVGDILTVLYDGSAVRYCRNGVVMFYTTILSPITAPLFFDSSINSVGAALSNIRFGPLSSNNWNDLGGSGKPQNNATNGAPTGSLVAGVPAETIVSQAGNAVAAKPGFALNAYFDGEISGSANSTLAATFSVNPTGYTGSYSVRWVLNRLSGGPSSQGPFLSSASGNTVSVSASANIGRINYEVSVIVTHSGGLTASASGAASFVFGSA